MHTSRCLQDVGELQQAYTTPAAAPPSQTRVPSVHLCAYTQAPSAVFSMTSLSSGSPRHDPGTSHVNEAASVECTGVTGSQQDQGGNGVEYRSALLVAAVDGHVRMYSWDNAGECVCTFFFKFDSIA